MSRLTFKGTVCADAWSYVVTDSEGHNLDDMNGVLKNLEGKEVFVIIEVVE